MEKCCQLNDYSLFVDKVRENFKEEQEKGSSKEQSFSNAVSMAIEALPKDSEIKKFLEKNRAEVTGMCLKEYDEERAKRLFKQEGFEEGLVLGRQEGEKRGEKKFSSLMAKLLSVGKMDDMKRVIEDEEYRERLYMEYGITGSNE